MITVNTYMDPAELAYCVRAEQELSNSNPYENPVYCPAYFGAEIEGCLSYDEFIGPPTEEEHAFDVASDYNDGVLPYRV